MNKEQEEKILNQLQDITCKMIIAELESIREEINGFIDKLIEEKIKNYNE